MAKNAKNPKTKTGRYVARMDSLQRGLRLIPQIGEEVLAQALSDGLSQAPSSLSLLETLAERANVTAAEVTNAGAVAAFLLGMGQEEAEKEPFGEVLDDLVSADVLQEHIASDVHTILDSICEHADLIQTGDAQLRDFGVLRSVLPAVLGVYANWVSVPRFHPGYKAGDDPAVYTPELQDTALALAVQIDIDVFGTTKRFSLALRPRELDALILQLQAAQKQREVLE